MSILGDLKNTLAKSKEAFGKIASQMKRPFATDFERSPTLDRIMAVGDKLTGEGDSFGEDLPSKIFNRVMNLPSGIMGGALSNPVLNNPSASIPELVKSTIKSSAKGAIDVAKGGTKYTLQEQVPGKLGLKGIPALAVGLTAEILAPGPGEFGLLSKFGKEEDVVKKISNVIKGAKAEDVSLLVEKLGAKEVEKIIKNKASKNLISKAEQLIFDNRSVTNGIVKDVTKTMSPSEAEAYAKAAKEEITSLVNSAPSKNVGLPVLNPKPKALIEREQRLAREAKAAKDFESGFISEPNPSAYATGGGNAAENVNKLINGETPQNQVPVEDAVKVFQDALEKATNLRRQQEAIYSATRAKRFAEGFVARGEGGVEGFIKSKSAMSGEMEKVTTDALKESLTQPAIKGLFDKLSQSKLNQGEYLNAGEGLQNLLDGKLPTESQIELLNKVFPSDVVDNLVNNRSLVKKVIDAAGEVLNVPRALVASFDMSAPFRQGVFLVGRPKQFFGAFKNMFKYAFSEKAYEGLLADIKARPTYSFMEASNLAITDMGKLSGREEAFMSNLAEKIPGIGHIVKGSDRAYSGFLNKLRADVFDDLFRKANSLGVEMNGKTVDDMSKFINSATGRGDIGKWGDAAPIINGLLFSPRLMKSRLDLLNPKFYVDLDPFVRKEALKSLFTFASAGLTVLGISKLAGADVEVDPRSADFGKVKVGNTRYDPWGGFQQYIKLATQLITGQLKSSSTGKVYTVGKGYKPITRLDLLYRFIEQKEAPVPSFVTGLLRGKNSIGEDFNIPTEIQNRFVPLVLQDLKDLYDEGGIESVGMEIPAFFGVGVQTYSNETRKGVDPFGRPRVIEKPKAIAKPKAKSATVK